MEREIVTQFFKNLGFDVQSEDVRNKILNPTIETITQRCGKPIYPRPNESLAVSVMTPKTAALAFDRVYRIPNMLSEELVPEDIGFYGATRTEIGWHAMLLLYLCAYQVGIETEMNDLFIKNKHDSNLELKVSGEKDNLRFICSEFPSVFNQTPTFFYHSRQNYLNDFPVGPQKVLIRAISNVAMVDEEKLEWSQVLEFRRDEAAKIKYKRFVRWAETELLTKSLNQIEDEIAIKLDDYNWTLKKHGIQTAIGTLSSLIDAKFLGSSSVATAAALLAGGETLAALTSTTLAVGKIAISFGTKYIENLEIRRKENYEIAYIHDIKKQFK